MADKPLETADWATDANYPADGGPGAGTATKVAASPTRKARGWRPRQKPPAQNLNYWMNLVGRWTAWLYDGILGSVEIDDLLVTGNLTVEGDTYHGVRNLPIPAASAQPEPTPIPWYYARTTPGWQLPVDGTGRITYGIVGIREGDRLHAFGINYRKLSDAGTTLNMRFLKHNQLVAGVTELAIHPGVATNAPGYNQMTFSIPNTPDAIVEAYTSYSIEVWSSNNDGSDGNVDCFRDAYVNVSHPDPTP